MEPPLTCDRCGCTVLDEDESSATVVDAGSSLDDAAYFIAVREATLEDGALRVVDADVFCADHAPDTAYEYGDTD